MNFRALSLDAVRAPKGGPLDLVLLAARRVRRRMRIRQGQRQLQDLPDYLLRDIGITRAQIEDATEFGRRGFKYRR